MEIEVKNFHPLEVRLLRHVSAGEDITAERIVRELDYKIGQCNQSFSWLCAKGCLEETARKTVVTYELTETGKAQAETGTPAQRIFDLLKGGEPLALPEIAEKLGLEKSDIGSAYGSLSKAGTCAMNAENKAYVKNDALPADVVETAELLKRGLNGPVDEAEMSDREKELMGRISKKRGAAGSPYKMSEREEVTYRMTKVGEEAKDALLKANITGEEIGVLTPQIISTGSWKTASFRPYGLDAPVQRLIPGRHNPYANYIQWVKDKLTSLGFEEFDGPLVENEFWNGDALFMPQFHSARDIHDVYYVKEPRHCREIEEPWLSNVANTHENGGNTGSRGWQYKFDHEFTRRQILRSQGTVLSAHQLTKAKVPGKYFGIVRCFRFDEVDAKHGADFYQTEGIVIGKEANLKDLLGLLKMFAVEVAGATDFKYVPGYFPFTEPSIEIHIKHPVLGWFEMGGSGIFRPEVTKSLGIDEPVLAWGLGIDRMAMMHLGINDIRDLFSPNIDSVRTRRGN